MAGRPRHRRRVARSTGQTYTVRLDDVDLREPHQVSYTYTVLVQRNGNTIQFDIAQPSRRVRIEFLYGGCGIRYVNVSDFFAGVAQPRISRSPASTPSPAVAVDFDGWVFPKSGVAFVWVLDPPRE